MNLKNFSLLHKLAVSSTDWLGAAGRLDSFPLSSSLFIPAQRRCPALTWQPSPLPVLLCY